MPGEEPRRSLADGGGSDQSAGGGDGNAKRRRIAASAFNGPIVAGLDEGDAEDDGGVVFRAAAEPRLFAVGDQPLKDPAMATEAPTVSGCTNRTPCVVARTPWGMPERLAARVVSSAASDHGWMRSSVAL